MTLRLLVYSDIIIYLSLHGLDQEICHQCENNHKGKPQAPSGSKTTLNGFRVRTTSRQTCPLTGTSSAPFPHIGPHFPQESHKPSVLG